MGCAAFRPAVARAHRSSQLASKMALKPLSAERPPPIASAVGSSHTMLLQCLEATERAVGGGDGWVTARAVARRLGPTADPERIGRELTRLSRFRLVELWFQGGASYYRCSR